PVLDVKMLNIEKLPPTKIDFSLLKKLNVLPYKIVQNTLYIATADPLDLNTVEEIKFLSQCSIETRLAPYDEIKRKLSLLSKSDQPTNTTHIEHHGPMDEKIVQLINEIIEKAIHQSASDIHFEVYEKYCRIRFRLDGFLTQISSFETTLAPKISVRLKIMSKLDIAEKRLPQDGRIKIDWSHLKKSIDMRVSSCPTLWGEKIVLRLLENNEHIRSLQDLSFNTKQYDDFLTAIKKPQGIILVTGPTGSGKTVSLYAALKTLNTSDKNILTVEDPVEINLPGINQVHINIKAGLTFPIALRAFLRQDPDIIMIGEIRDRETAEIAIKAAQTGHLVLATLHTNSAFDTINRLKNMGIEPYNLASAITLVTAQRLARKLCSTCKIQKVIPASVAKTLDLPQDTQAFFANGCDKCNQGYKGRVAIHEIVPLSDTLQTDIFQENSNRLLREHAKQQHIFDLQASGIEKIKQGVLSIDEFYRVVQS
ncbi:MAG: Flp pilus assembly complex ATPase component TadA, partial [Gammaproteobacteria bacterium]|nr:Flp pilus assembly complex ATPase component TadA [Gammaproteobacteria bacterium]